MLGKNGFVDLLRAEDTVAGIAQAGDDVAMLVELFIHGGNVNFHVGVVGADALDALGGGEDVHELDVLHAVFLHEGDGGGGGAAGGQHGVEDDDIPLGDVGGHLAVILHRLQGLGVPEEADVTDLGGGDQGEDTLDHTQARPQDGDDGQLLAGQLIGHGLCHGGLNLHRLERQVPGGVVAHEGGNLAHDLAEVLHAGGLIPQDGQLML